MLQVNGVSLQYGSKKLFEDVNLKFTNGNCYGIIGANGAGKSTFLKILAGEIEPNKGDVTLGKNERMSVLAQDQTKYDSETVLRTVMLGHKRLVDIMDEKDALYASPEFTDADGERAAELDEGNFIVLYEFPNFLRCGTKERFLFLRKLVQIRRKQAQRLERNARTNYVLIKNLLGIVPPIAS